MSLLVENEYGQVSCKGLTAEPGAPEALVIRHRYCTATLSLLGGQLLLWQPEGNEPVLWLSDSATFAAGKAIRGGIPICWPWFGGYQDGGNHGFVRQARWQLDLVLIEPEQVIIELSFTGEHCHPLWPASFALHQRFVLGHTLQQQLQISNLSAEPVRYSGALHSYFRVSSPDNVVIPALAAAPFDDKLTGGQQLAPAAVSAVGPVDRIYHSAAVMQLEDSAWQRTLEISASGCAQWVLWNPGVEESKNIADVHAGGEQQFVCLEAANTEWQDVLPGQSVTMAQSIRVLAWP